MLILNLRVQLLNQCSNLIITAVVKLCVYTVLNILQPKQSYFGPNHSGLSTYSY